MEEFLQRALTLPALTIDIETSPFAARLPVLDLVMAPIVLLFLSLTSARRGTPIGPDKASEVRAWGYVQKLCSLPNCKILQNGMYDITWLWRKVGITLAGSLDDTMLFHHSMFPEMTKGLDFFRLYLRESPAWKTLHRRGEYNKAEE